MCLLQILLVAGTFNVAQASHFRGAIITWKPGTQQVTSMQLTILFQQRVVNISLK